MTVRAFVDSSGETRLIGTLVPDPGGSRPVGPFLVTYNDPDIGNDPGVHCLDLAAGTFLLGAWAITTTTWTTSGGTGTVSIYLAVSMPLLVTTALVTEYATAGATTVGAEPQTSDGGINAPRVRGGLIPEAGSVLAMQAYADAGSLTGGASAVYALIATL